MSAEIDLSYKNRPVNQYLEHIPGSYGWPYLGKVLELLDDAFGYVEKNYKEHGEVFKTKVAGLPGVMVLGPDNHQKIYLDRDKCFSAQMGYDTSLAHFWPGGVLMRDHDEHKIQRRMFQTAFKKEQMQSYISIMNPIFEDEIKEWGKTTDFLFFPTIKQVLLNVGASVFIGVKEYGEEMEKMNKAFLNMTEDGLMGLVKWDVPGFKYHKGMNGARYLDRYFANLIPQRRSGNGKDMLSFMAKEKQDDGEYFPISDITKQASFLLFAAHDTTTSTLTHILLYTALNPEWQEKLREEAQALGRSSLEYDDLDNMTLMDYVFKETLRLTPSLPLMQRRTTKECEIGGYQIPADTIIFIPTTFNHYRPEIWSNPNLFDPLRFAPGREEHKGHAYAFMPFGGGAHKCIGMHFASMLVKTFMHQLLLEYEWTLPEGYSPKMESFPLPKTSDGLPIKLNKI